MRQLAVLLAVIFSSASLEASVYVASPNGYADGSVIGLQIDTSVPRALVHKSGGGTFSSSGTMVLRDASNTTIASVPYSNGQTVVTVPFSWTFTTGSLTYNALASGNSNPSGNVMVTAYPNQPSGVGATVDTSNSVRISWNSTSGATRYKVRNKTTGAESADVTGTSYTWSGLTSGTSYCFTVIGCNVTGVCGSESAQACAAPAVVPAVPSNVTSSVASPTSVTVSWASVANATRYKVRNKITGTESADVTGTSYTWSGLTSGTNYCFTVIACNIPGVCGGESVQTCATPIAVPAAPSTVTSSIASPTSVTVAWASVANATRYKVRNKTTGTESADVTGTSYTWSGLTSGTNYCFTVIACNIPGVCGGESVQTCASPAAVPAAPSTVTSSIASPTSVTVAWASVANATRYKVRNKTTGAESADVTGTSYTWYGLTSGTNYCFTVIACNIPGVCGGESVQTCATPVAVPAAPSTVTSSIASPTSVTVAWASVANATRYKVRNKTTGAESADVTGTSYTWYGLTSGTNYCFTVIACNIPGVCGGESVQTCATPVAVPAAPSTVTSSIASPTSVTVAWASVANATRYKVRNKTTGTESADVTSISYTWSGLTSGTNYCFAVIACNFPGVCGGESVQTCATPVAVPAAPSTVTLSVASPTSVTVLWGSVANATRYKVRNKTTGAESADVTGTSYTWSGLTSGTNYCFTVIACNIPGVCGGESVQTCATPVAVPAAPSTVTSSVASPTSVTVLWGSVANATRYKVRNKTTGAESADVTGTSYTWSELTSGTSYCFTVVACNIPGICGSESVQTCTTPVTVPAAPSNAAASVASPTSVTVLWGSVANATRYKVRNKTTGTESADITGTSYTWSGLTSGTSYCFTVIACNIPGVCGSESAQTCATPAPPCSAPGKFTLALPSEGSSNRAQPVTLQWTLASSAASYEVFTGTATYALRSAGTTTATSFVLQSLAAGTRYYWRVIARASCGASTESAIASFTTAPPPSAAPALYPTATPLNRASGQVGQATFVWSVDAENAASVEIDIRNPILGSITTFAMIPAGNGTGRQTYSYQQSLNSVTTYAYRFHATGTNGTRVHLPADDQSFYSGPQVLSPPSCAEPGMFAMTAPSTGAAVSQRPTLSWSAAYGAAFYDVSLWRTNGGVPARVASVAALSYTSPPLDAATTYSWKVVARSSCEGVTESSSGTRTFTTASAPAPQPDAPQFLGSPAVSPAEGVKQSDTFRWTAQIRNASSATVVIIDPVHFAENRFAMTRIASASNVDTFEFRKTLLYDGIYAFRVEAVSATGISAGAPAGNVAGPAVFAAPSTPLTITIALTPPEPLAGELVKFDGSVPGSGLSFRWGFGDGATSSDPAPSHAFENPGTYDITLTVTTAAAGNARLTIAGADVRGNAARSVTVRPRTGWVTIKGAVRFDDDTPIEGAVIDANPVSFAPNSEIIHGTTDKDGAYTIGVPASTAYSWRITARGKFNLGGQNLFKTYNDVTVPIANGATVNAPTLKVHLPVVFIHGWGGEPERWKQWAKSLSDRSIPSKAVDFSMKDPDSWLELPISKSRTADDIAYGFVEPQIIEYLSTLRCADPHCVPRYGPTDNLPMFKIIAHSKGGLVARALGYNSLLAAKLKRVATLGTPNNGVRLALFGDMSESTVQSHFNPAFPTFGVAWPSVLAMVGCGDWVVRYQTLPFTIHYGDVKIRQVQTGDYYEDCRTDCVFIPAILTESDHQSFGATSPIDSEVLALFETGKNTGRLLNAEPPEPCKAWSALAPHTDAVTAVPPEPADRVDATNILLDITAPLQNGIARLPFTVERPSSIVIATDSAVRIDAITDPNGLDHLGEADIRSDVVSTATLTAGTTGQWSVTLSSLIATASPIRIHGDTQVAFGNGPSSYDVNPGEMVRLELQPSSTEGYEITTLRGAMFHGADRVGEYAGDNRTISFAAPSAPGQYLLRASISGKWGAAAFERQVLLPVSVKTAAVRFDGVPRYAFEDANRDGALDRLRVEIPLNATGAGAYLLNGDLLDDAGNVIARAAQRVVLAAGESQRPSLAFDLATAPCTSSARWTVSGVRLSDTGNGLVSTVSTLAALGIPRPQFSIECGASMLAADFRVSGDAAVMRQSIAFENFSVGAVAAISWDFGDGGSSTEANPTHAYASEGTYYVTLRITDGVRSDFITRPIVVTSGAPRRHAAPH